MARKSGKKRKRAGRTIRHMLLLTVIGIAGIAGWNWLNTHPQHNPFAPLDLRDPIGWATARKLIALKSDTQECRAVLDHSEVAYAVLPATGEGACARPDRTQLEAFPLAPGTPTLTCPVATALELWRTKSVDQAALEYLGGEVVRIEHMGAFNCRRMRGSGSGGGWSEHATANAIDISAFELADGRRITVLDDWDGDADRAGFLRAIRDDACGVFATVLSPDFNAAHADHFHLDQSSRWVGVCR